MNNLREYAKTLLVLTKPGIIIGNSMVAAAVYVYASNDSFAFSTLLFFVIGTAMIIAASCVVNNFMDADIDKHMARTAKRPSVTQRIRPYDGFVFAAVLFVLGVLLLVHGVNERTAQIGILGAILYVLVYTPLKKRSHYATAAGTVPGAIPVLAGFAAAESSNTLAMWTLFALMVFWQMAHFYAIAIYRRQDYAAAHVPTVVAVRGLRATIWQMRLYISVFITSIVVLAAYGSLHMVLAVPLLALGFYWGYVALQHAESPEKWARRVFKTSLLVLPLLSVLLVMQTVVS